MPQLSGNVKIPGTHPELAYYPMNSNANDILEDVNGLHNGIINGTTEVEGQVGGALSFNGTSSDNGTLPLSLSEQFTSICICGYIYPVSNPTQGPICAMWNGGSSYSWLLDIVDPNIRFVVSKTQSSGSADIAQTSITNNTWTFFVAWSIDGTVGIRLNMGTPVTVSGPANLVTRGQTLTVGYKGDSLGVRYNGRMDQLRFFGDLPSDEVLQGYMDETSETRQGTPKEGIRVTAMTDTNMGSEEIVSSAVTDENGDYTLSLLPALTPIIVTARDDYGSEWAASTPASLGDRVHSGTNSYNVVFECTTSGTTGSTEPTWDTNVDGTTNDNDVVWTARAFLRPITHGPVMTGDSPAILKADHPNLLGFWKMEDLSIIDESSNANNGTYGGNPQINPGSVGDCVRLDGSGDYISIPHLSAYHSNKIVFSLFTSHVSDGSNAKGVIYKNQDTGFGREYTLAFSTTRTIVFNVSTGSQIIDIASTSTFGDNEVFHVVCQLDRTSGVSMELYINGVLEDSHTSGDNIVTNSRPIEFGRMSEASQAGRYLNGIIDQVRIFDRWLTQDEINDLSNEALIG